MTHYKYYEANVETNQVLVLLHGFLSDSRTYYNHIDKYTDICHVITIDLPGHGEDQSSMDETWNFDYITTSLDRILDKYKDKSITLFGYSMGGRVALYYAINGHIPISNLILESTSPGIKEEANQLERRLVDDARAKVLDIAGIELFVNDWEKLPLFQSQLELPVEIQHQIRLQRLSQSPQKMAKALRDYGTGQMPNLWPRLKEIKVPTLILAGEYDEKFVQIAKKMANLIPNSKCKLISATGHTIHVEDSDEFDTMILGFLKEEQND
ncbi:2-succinyl-6-hydroxy-2,4-cyclohexadiene-1-carboxylate synthase [Staphylococcus aureus]|uniref:2-succinyl-6-hydroxy-2, 4-cyclohexadiene-1-carboxylate synthase n=1 Tax=Staphylococcus aureus TaxID=1280 RepID=UPI0009338C02|nr:2-succinyl-6-hydroxy-2,4-cyclohexadiene-1-carboxylate synthase [Staphylococcus aureus]OJZ45916.1 2-succinyl-6-hydroxy-2,4-cyclohexadiene-1-carboxylate synthase [Staphylococcus aureus]